jgi:hypothetical protein
MLYEYRRNQIFFLYFMEGQSMDTSTELSNLGLCSTLLTLRRDESVVRSPRFSGLRIMAASLIRLSWQTRGIKELLQENSADEQINLN